MKKCFIIAGGDFDGFFDEINENDLVITADKGFRYAEKEKIKIATVPAKAPSPKT